MTEPLIEKLHNAIINNNAESVKILLVSCDNKTINSCYRGETAMTAALENCSDDVILQLLMSHENFDVTVENRHKRSALFEAAKHGQDVIVEALLARGADVNVCDRSGSSPLHMCAFYNR